MMRLDRYLSEMGIGTRKKIKEMVRGGRITVDGSIAKNSDIRVDENVAVVCLDGKELSFNTFEYFLLNKPKGVVSATTDSVHKTVLELITETKRKDLFPVGRLDIDTEGLLLITNDGDLSHRLLAPGKHVDKCYEAVILGEVTEDDIRTFSEGMEIPDEKGSISLEPAGLVILESFDSYNEENEELLSGLSINLDMAADSLERDGAEKAKYSRVRITIHEGKYHQIKRMFEAVGKRVVYLKRISMGSLTLPDDLNTGEYKRLTKEEVYADLSL